MHSKSNNIEVMLYDNANEVVNEVFESLLSWYQIGLETSMRGGDFILDSVQLINYNAVVVYWFSRLDKNKKKEQ